MTTQGSLELAGIDPDGGDPGVTHHGVVRLVEAVKRAGIERVKIFNSRGDLVYSDDRKLIGRNVGGSLYAINKARIEDYVKGVIANESPSSWPQAALRAQAVAARSYALATRLNGNGYDLYDDTRSQVYGGRSSETGATNNATDATAGEVIKGQVEVRRIESQAGQHLFDADLIHIAALPLELLLHLIRLFVAIRVSVVGVDAGLARIEVVKHRPDDQSDYGGDDDEPHPAP